MDRIITMIIRQITNRLIRVGIDKGVDAVANRKKGAEAAPADPAQQKAQEKAQKDTSRRAKQAMRLGRKISRF